MGICMTKLEIDIVVPFILVSILNVFVANNLDPY